MAQIQPINYGEYEPERLRRCKCVASVIREIVRNGEPALAKKLVYHAIWYVTETPKKFGIPISTPEARLIPISKRQNNCTHEHVFRIKFLLKQLLEEPESAETLLAEKAIACLVTRLQGEKLSSDDRCDDKNDLYTDGWARYPRSGIVYEPFSSPADVQHHTPA